MTSLSEHCYALPVHDVLFITKESAYTVVGLVTVFVALFNSLKRPG